MYRLLRSNPILMGTRRVSPALFRGGVNVRSIFIDSEATPNPHSYKFMPGKTVLPEAFGTGMHFTLEDRKSIQRSPLAKSLFSIEGVTGVFLGRDFITVTKKPEEAWPVLKPIIFSNILDFIAGGQPSVVDKPVVSDTTVLESDSPVVALIKELMETKVRPSVQEDGGDIFFVSFDELKGIVRVKLAGSCVGCPSSSVTLRNGVERMLMHYVPEVKGIENVTDELDSAAKLEFKPEPV